MEVYYFKIKHNSLKKCIYVYRKSAMLITSIDVGIIHFGLTMTEVSDTYELKKILFCKLIDMTVMRHNTKSREQCKLHHDNCTADWITHMVQEYPKPFYNSDIILIERQPPQGHKDVEQLIALLFRDKIKLISPNSMHAYFGIGHLDYDQRKDAVEKITNSKLTNIMNKETVNYIGSLYRKHDLCDAFCIMIYFTDKEREKYRINNISKNVAEKLREKQLDLDSFRYIPNKLVTR